MHPLQAMINGLSADDQRARSGSQMTLGALLDALGELDPDRQIEGFGEPMSYRGYYDDLAFEMSDVRVTVAEVLAAARGAMGRAFTGYKGGEYVMGELTPVWIAAYGCLGERLIGLDTSGERVVAVTAPDDE